MKKEIKFTTKYKTEFINDLRAQVKDYFEKNKLSKYGDASIITKSILMVSVYFLPYIFLMTGLVDSLLGLFIAWFTMGLGMAGVGMVLMHDANHRSFSKNPKVNKWLSKSLYFLGGFPPNWRHQHNTLHHGFTNIEGHDEDINTPPILRLSPHKPLLKAHRYQYIYAWFLYSLMTIMWVTTKDFVQLNRYRKSGKSISNTKKYSQLFLDLIIAKLSFYIIFIALPLIILPFAWYWIILGFMLMLATSGFILTVIFQTAHIIPSSEFPLPDKEGNIENNWAIHQLLNTANYSPKSRIFSWLIGGLNYQVEHHLFPNISHVHYKNLSKLVKKTTEKYNLPYYVQQNFFIALLGHFKMLKALGKP